MKALFLSYQIPTQTSEVTSNVRLPQHRRASRKCITNFKEGFKNKGFQLEYGSLIDTDETIFKNFDLIITWGYFNHIHNICKVINTPYLIAERGFLGNRIGTEGYSTLSYGGLNGRGIFSSIKQHSSDRREEHFPGLFSDYMANYDPNGHIILAAQVPRDRSLIFVPDEVKNYSNMIKDILSRFPNRKIVFSQHPDLNKSKINTKILEETNVVIDENKKLEDTFKGAKALVTINSNSALLARIAGLEVYDYDVGSMSYSANKRINEEWWSDTKESRKIIEQLCDNIAHYQYTTEEIRSGLPWDNISKVLQHIYNK